MSIDIALSKRLVEVLRGLFTGGIIACPWRETMLMLDSGVEDISLGRVVWGPPSLVPTIQESRDHRATCRTGVYDYEDPATRACLLELLREAAKDPHIIVEPHVPVDGPEGAKVQWCILGMTRAPHDTEGLAVVHALIEYHARFR